MRTERHSRADKHLEAWGMLFIRGQLSWFLKTNEACADEWARQEAMGPLPALLPAWHRDLATDMNEI